MNILALFTKIAPYVPTQRSVEKNPIHSDVTCESYVLQQVQYLSAAGKLMMWGKLSIRIKSGGLSPHGILSVVHEKKISSFDLHCHHHSNLPAVPKKTRWVNLPRKEKATSYQEQIERTCKNLAGSHVSIQLQCSICIGKMRVLWQAAFGYVSSEDNSLHWKKKFLREIPIDNKMSSSFNESSAAFAASFLLQWNDSLTSSQVNGWMDGWVDGW